jgi:hypothetical protein
VCNDRFNLYISNLFLDNQRENIKKVIKLIVKVKYKDMIKKINFKKNTNLI